MVKIRITNSFGEGYTTGQEVDVEPAEAKRLQDLNKCEVISPTATPKKENAVASGPAKAEKAVVQ